MRSIIFSLMLFACIYVNAQGTLYTTGHGTYSEEMVAYANKGDAKALNDLGSCYDRGAGVAQNHAKAFEFFQASSEKGWLLGYYNLGLYYERGYACDKDYQKAFDLYSKALKVAPNFAPAMLRVGVLHANGLGTKKNLNLAQDYFAKVEQKGSIGEKWELANMYLKGIDIPQNKAKALPLLAECEAKKFPNEEMITLLLATTYEGGINGTPDYVSALKYWKKLTQVSYERMAEGEYKVGEYYDYGRGVERNKQEAISWYTKAADKGYAPAQLNLGNCYIPNDYKKVVYWLTKAYENNYLPTCHNLADCYYHGNGVAQSYEKAFEIFQKGADTNPNCLYRLGVMYKEGLGIASDMKKGFQLLIKAADKGVGDAQYLVGMDLYNGEYVPQNYKESVRYLEMALKDQYMLKDARGEIMRKLSACYRFGRGVETDMEKADYYMEEAAKCGDADAVRLMKYFHLSK